MSGRIAIWLLATVLLTAALPAEALTDPLKMSVFATGSWRAKITPTAYLIEKIAIHQD